jgi:hypothetical protein
VHESVNYHCFYYTKDRIVCLSKLCGYKPKNVFTIERSVGFDVIFQLGSDISVSAVFEPRDKDAMTTIFHYITEPAIIPMVPTGNEIMNGKGHCPA